MSSAFEKPPADLPPNESRFIDIAAIIVGPFADLDREPPSTESEIDTTAQMVRSQLTSAVTLGASIGEDAKPTVKGGRVGGLAQDAALYASYLCAAELEPTHLAPVWAYATQCGFYLRIAPNASPDDLVPAMQQVVDSLKSVRQASFNMVVAGMTAIWMQNIREPLPLLDIS